VRDGPRCSSGLKTAAPVEAKGRRVGGYQCRRLSPREAAQRLTPSSRASPIPSRRALPATNMPLQRTCPCNEHALATNMPTRMGPIRAGSLGASASPLAMPTHCSSRSATTVTRSIAATPSAARCCQTSSAYACSRASVEPNAAGASASAWSRNAASEALRQRELAELSNSWTCRDTYCPGGGAPASPRRGRGRRCASWCHRLSHQRKTNATTP